MAEEGTGVICRKCSVGNSNVACGPLMKVSKLLPCSTAGGRRGWEKISVRGPAGCWLTWTVNFSGKKTRFDGVNHR